MKQHIGKYATGRRKADQQRKAERDLPTEIKAINKRLREINAEKCSLLANGQVTDRERFAALSREYAALLSN